MTEVCWQDVQDAVSRLAAKSPQYPVITYNRRFTMNRLDVTTRLAREAEFYKQELQNRMARFAEGYGMFYRVKQARELWECAVYRLNAQLEDNEVFAKAALAEQAEQAELVTEDGEPAWTRQATVVGPSRLTPENLEATLSEVASQFGQVEYAVVKDIVWATLAVWEK